MLLPIWSKETNGESKRLRERECEWDRLREGDWEREKEKGIEREYECMRETGEGER